MAREADKSLKIAEAQSRTDVLAWAFTLERVTGIEPALSAWEADVLPLNYIRKLRQSLGHLRRPRQHILQEHLARWGAPLPSGQLRCGPAGRFALIPLGFVYRCRRRRLKATPVT